METKKVKETEEQHPNVKTKCKAYVGTEPYLFVSYSHSDSAQVYPVLDKLTDHKYRLWYDKACESGHDFRDELKEQIEACSGVLFFVSESSMASPFCCMEIFCAKENNKRIFPIYIKDNPKIPPAFELLLKYLHHVSVTDMDNLESTLLRDLPPETMDRLTFNESMDVLENCEDNGEKIEVPEGIRIISASAFQNRNGFKSISLPASLENIESEAFRSCSNLKSINIPMKTDRIGNSAFRDCIRLKKLNIENSLIKIGDRAFENCSELEDVSLPSELTEIYASVFNGCKKLKSIKLPTLLTVLGENAFGDCVALEEIDLPETIIKIDDFVFSGCSKLSKIGLPEGLKKIGKAAFKNCESLTTVNIPASVTYLSPDLFRGCINLRSIIVNPKNRYYKSEPNKRDGADQVLFNKNKSVIIAYPANSKEVQYDIPDSVTNISDWTFSECKLSRVSIPDSVNEIGEGAFCNCKRLDEIVIPDTVDKIDDCAFRGCENLERILVPDSVVELGWGLFDDCSKNLVVYCNEGSDIHAYCERNKIKTDSICNMENN